MFDEKFESILDWLSSVKECCDVQVKFDPNTLQLYITQNDHTISIPISNAMELAALMMNFDFRLRQIDIHF